MPDKANHVAQAQHNAAFLETIDVDVYPDWALTVVFYTAVHAIDGKLADSNIHPDNHNSRDTHVANHPELKSVYSEYRKLKTDSFNARYYPPFFQSDTYVDISKTLYLGRIQACCA